MKKEELIDKYLAGTLNDQELTDFEQMRKADPSFEKEISFFSDLTSITTEDERIRLKASLKNSSKGRTIEKKHSGRILYLILAFVLIILAIITYIYMRSEPSSQEIYADYFAVYPNTYQAVTRNSEDNIITQAFTAYENGNYQLASERFKVSLEREFNPNIAFFLGNSLGAIEVFEEAIDNMEKVISSNSEYSNEANWYLAILNLRNGNNEAVIKFINDYLEYEGFKKNEEEALELVKIISQRD